MHTEPIPPQMTGIGIVLVLFGTVFRYGTGMPTTLYIANIINTIVKNYRYLEVFPCTVICDVIKWFLFSLTVVQLSSIFIPALAIV